jgi:hypothetical protein
MPNASYYVRQAKILLSISSGSCDPVVSDRVREVAEDYLAKAVKLKIGHSVPPVPRPPDFPRHA